jgi:hypothetical protein
VSVIVSIYLLVLSHEPLLFLPFSRIDKADEYEVCLCLKSQRKDGFVLYINLVVKNWLD